MRQGSRRKQALIAAGRPGRAAGPIEAQGEDGVGEAMATETGHPWGIRHRDAGITWRLQIIPQKRATHIPGDGEQTDSQNF